MNETAYVQKLWPEAAFEGQTGSYNILVIIMVGLPIINLYNRTVCKSESCFNNYYARKRIVLKFFRPYLAIDARPCLNFYGCLK